MLVGQGRPRHSEKNSTRCVEDAAPYAVYYSYCSRTATLILLTARTANDRRYCDKLGICGGNVFIKKVIPSFTQNDLFYIRFYLASKNAFVAFVAM